MQAWEITEDSPDSPNGSRSKDLNLGKLWLLTELNRRNLDQFDNVYVLGSWYGSLGPYLIFKNLNFKQAYLVDIDPKKTSWVQDFNKKLGIDNKITAITQDCCKIKFTGKNILVINTSTNDIPKTQWLDHVPLGSVIAVQGRDNQPNNPNNLHQTLESFNQSYPLSSTFFLNQISLVDPRGEKYKRFMKIGIR